MAKLSEMTPAHRILAKWWPYQFHNRRRI